MDLEKMFPGEVVVASLYEASRLTGISRMSIYRRLWNGSFPAPVLELEHGGQKQRYWLKSQLLAYVDGIRKRLEKEQTGGEKRLPGRPLKLSES